VPAFFFSPGGGGAGRSLSPSGPMVLIPQGIGRVGRCRAFSFPLPLPLSTAIAHRGLHLSAAAADVPLWHTAPRGASVRLTLCDFVPKREAGGEKLAML